ncbi:MAG: F0F1 ATP synthase subunit epsilon [Gammaproteobacteria bacterium]|nr:F0F1 ATP synthase subunit epsilon [Gammaproteobacteria bacterium]
MESTQLNQTFRKTFQLDIVNAEESIYSGKAKMVIVTGELGELGILPDHTPLLSGIKPGQVRLIDTNDKESSYYISGGFIEVQYNVVTILADTVIRAEDIDEQRALEAKERAEKALLGAKKLDDYYNTMVVELAKAVAQLRVARSRRR